MTFNATGFFDCLRKRTGRLTALKVDGINAVMTACEGAPLAHAAYMLATAWHETAGTMQPVREAYWMSEAWRKRNLRYFPHYGRGYVQLTWPENYAKADAALDLDGALIADLDLAMRPDIAAQIMRRGMDEGWFAGDRKGRHTLRRHLPFAGVATRAQYVAARRIINGTDKADLVEDYAQWFERALLEGGWDE